MAVYFQNVFLAMHPGNVFFVHQCFSISLYPWINFFLEQQLFVLHQCCQKSQLNNPVAQKFPESLFGSAVLYFNLELEHLFIFPLVNHCITVKYVIWECVGPCRLSRQLLLSPFPILFTYMFQPMHMILNTVLTSYSWPS